MRYLAILLVALPSVFLVACGKESEKSTTTAPSTDLAAIAGKWHGELTENTGKKFEIEVVIQDSLVEGKTAAIVTYPGLGSRKGCSGIWRYTTQSKGKGVAVYEFEETITKGISNVCDGVGSVALTERSATPTLRYNWSDQKGDSSRGRLERD